MRSSPSYADSVTLPPSRDSECRVFQYGAGCEQQFTEEDYLLSPSELIQDGYDPAAGKNTIPLAILMETDHLDGKSVEWSHDPVS